MYSYAYEAALRKESYLAKIKNSRKSSTDAHESASLCAGAGADAKDEEVIATLEDDGGGGRLYVAIGNGQEDGSGGGGAKLYVAVGKDEEEGRSNLLWATRNLLADGDKLVLLHVHQPADRIMTGFRWVDASQLQEKELKAYRKSEKEEMTTLLDQYLDFCTASLKTQAEAMVIESNSPANGIVKLIEQNHITNLVMGTSSFSPSVQTKYSFITRKRKEPKSKVAAIVHLQAKPYCQIFYICNETLACSREATQLTSKVESAPSSSTSTDDSYQPKFNSRSQSLSPEHPSFLGFTDQQALQGRTKPVSYTYPSPGSTADEVENLSGSTWWSIDMTQTSFSLNSSQPSTGGSSKALKDLNSMNVSPVHVSIDSYKEHRQSMVETGMQHDVFEELYRVCDELERSKKEASEGQQKAERDMLEASMTFKAQENALPKEKKEVEDRLTKKKTGLKKGHLRIRNEMQKANEQKAELKNKLLQTNSLWEELQRSQGELQIKKDHVAKKVEQMCQTNNNSVFAFGSTTSAIAITEFSYTEIKEATNNFHESKKIGEGGCGSVYKGFLRHTTVAIKTLNRGGTTGDKEFNDEVETLCRMRHPNLVTLIGVCREAKALVFEFLSNGSLEDCLQREHKREALSWRMRIRIAADICTGLIFLHSNRPKGIAHGDLKPDNVLLDAGFVCKLADFGISRPLNVTNTTITPYHRTNQLKGTMGYMDPAYLASGELTAQYDVYSFGVVLMRLLTNKSPLGLPTVVEGAMRKGMLRDIIDTSAGEWPPECAQELARLALQCCRYERKERPDLAKEAWGVLQAMMNRQDEKCKPPTFFICPMTKEIMRDPHIAADGFTYEGDAIKHWFQMGNRMSPMAYVSFAHHELIPNNALRFAIQEWKRRQQP